MDKFKKEVVRNWDRRVTKLVPDGGVVMNNGTILALADGTEHVRDAKDGYRQEFSDGVRYFPAKWTVGYSEKAQYKKTWKEPNRSGVETMDATIKVLGKETVTVPAGEFETLKVQISGSIEAQVAGAARSSFGYFTEVYWYVPALHYFVASEYERRWGNNLDKFERNELTSYSVRSATTLAKQ